MSCANILGTSPVRGTVCADDVLSAYGVLTIASAGTSSGTVTIPFLKTTDVVLWGVQRISGAGGNLPFGGTATITNSGLINATLQLTGWTAGGAGVVTDFWYMVLAGETA